MTMKYRGLRYLSDFVVGQRFAGETRFRIDGERMKQFAAEFDPQPFHLDERAAEGTLFRGLAASGWHTGAATMRLLVESDLKPVNGILGAGIDQLRWVRPVRPGDELRVESEVLEVIEPQPPARYGTVRVRTTTVNQAGDVVQTFIATLLVDQRPR